MFLRKKTDVSPVATLTRYGQNMGSAHHLHEVNIWQKFHENPSSRFEDIKLTRFYGHMDRQTDIQHKNNIISPVYRGRHNDPVIIMKFAWNQTSSLHKFMLNLIIWWQLNNDKQVVFYWSKQNTLLIPFMDTQITKLMVNWWL